MENFSLVIMTTISRVTGAIFIFENSAVMRENLFFLKNFIQVSIKLFLLLSYIDNDLLLFINLFFEVFVTDKMPRRKVTQSYVNSQRRKAARRKETEEERE